MTGCQRSNICLSSWPPIATSIMLVVRWHAWRVRSPAICQHQRKLRRQKKNSNWRNDDCSKRYSSSSSASGSRSRSSNNSSSSRKQKR